MNKLAKLQKVSDFLRNFRLPGRQDVRFSFVTSQVDATSRLDKSAGIQVLVARPEMRTFGTSADIDSVIFVLEKDLGNGRTFERECEQFDRLAEVADQILTQMELHLEEGTCRFAGVRLDSVQIVPEVGLFGGWNGYSIELSFS